MIMRTASETLSLRVPLHVRQRLELAATRTRRSKAYLTVAALQKYLESIEREEMEEKPKGRADIARAYRGMGKQLLGRSRSAEEINAMIHDLRNDG